MTKSKTQMRKRGGFGIQGGVYLRLGLKGRGQAPPLRGERENEESEIG